MPTCLFCQSSGPFSTVEHIVPESLGNDNLLLLKQVCDSCQSYFGKEVEQFVLEKTPFAFWRTFLGIQTKRGHNPSVNMSQPKRQKGVFPIVHPMHDNVGFTSHGGSTSVDVDDPDLINAILDGNKTQFNFVMTPKVLHMLGRFLCKVGLELICSSDPDRARADTLSLARRYARFGNFDSLWPFFHFSKGAPSDFIQVRQDDEGMLEDVHCYSYSLLEFRETYILFHFCMGTDNWVISLNDPYPHPVIRSAFPEHKLNLIWYDNSEWKTMG